LFPEHLGGQRFARLRQAFGQRAPAIVENPTAVQFEAVREPGRRATAFDRLQRDANFQHGMTSANCLFKQYAGESRAHTQPAVTIEL
jgi:hypothetical protein